MRCSVAGIPGTLPEPSARYTPPSHGEGLSLLRRGPRSATAEATRWWPRGAASIRTSRRCGSSWARPQARVRLHALPEGRQGHQGRLGAARACRTRASSASASRSKARWRTWSRAARRSTTSTSSRSPTATRATTWPSRCVRAWRRSTGSPPSTGRSTRSRREEIVESVARAALLGARGNSGVILSQLIRGAAEELISRPGELVDPVLIGAAMARAAQRAYASVRAPAEGTMLTVMREMAAHVASELAHMEDAAPGAGRRATSSSASSPTCSSTRSRPARRRCAAGPSCCRCCARRASSTPAATR